MAGENNRRAFAGGAEQGQTVNVMLPGPRRSFFCARRHVGSTALLAVERSRHRTTRSKMAPGHDRRPL